MVNDPGSDLLLVGDIGGTKTDLMILAPAAEHFVPLERARLRSAEYPDLSSLLQEFLRAVGLKIKRACLDVAGPVVDGHAQLTNLPWDVDGVRLCRELDLEAVDILNDLAAIAHAIPALQANDLLTLNAGSEHATGTKAIVAPGTGLGEAFLVWNGQSFQPCPSEGGHADFAPPNEALEALLPYMRKRVEHVSYELVCSGIGIPYLYEFFRDRSKALESPTLASELALASDRTPLIIAHALDPRSPCPLCRAALEAFIAILGAEAGNLALKVFALGGVYIAGGIAPRLIPLLKEQTFLSAFCNKGRFSQLLTGLPVWLITNPDVALMGCAAYGRDRIKKDADRSLPLPPANR